jgi:hypothetical protein
LPRRPSLKRCPSCSAEFTTRHPDQKFCSRRCAARGPRPNRRRKVVEPMQCVCGRTFIPKSPRVRFCSRTCGVRFGGSMHEKTCPTCSTLFQTKDVRRIYCSSRCRLEARRARIVRFCVACGAPYQGFDMRRKFCSRACATAAARRKRGDQAPNWKGGRTSTNGYVRVRALGHPRTTKQSPYVLEHILVMESTLGRYLLPNERVHHKNGQRDDNRPENLELWKMKDPPGVRASDYHCPGCVCPRVEPGVSETEFHYRFGATEKSTWNTSPSLVA